MNLNLLQKLFQPIFVRLYDVWAGGNVTAFDRAAYEHRLVRGVVDTIATHAAKAEAMHVVVDKNGRISQILRNSPYAKLLNFSPNPLMSGFDFKYRLFSQLEQYTTSFCYIRWNGLQPEMLLPVDYKSAKIYKPSGGGQYNFEFIDADGQQITVLLEDVIILRKLFGNGEIFGDGNAPVQSTLDMIKASDDAILEALCVSNKIRGLLKAGKSMLSKGDKDKNSDDFAAQYDRAAKKGGFITVDSTEDYKPLEAKTLTANALQVQEIKKDIFRYWHVCEAVATGDYSSDQYQSFFESVIEPRLICASQALTNGFFTTREKNVGNRIIFNSSLLMHSSPQTKISLVQTAKETGLLTVNEQRELFGYPPVEGGDDRQVSLNYVKAGDQTKYQTGAEETPEPGNDDAGGAKKDS
jgi:HK97 family phage portal protein